MILALAGGVGGAKLAAGLSAVLPPEQLAIVVNTGDDFEHLGLRISPDIDTVTYTLAGIANRELGWGIAGESWAFMDQLAKLGGESWFRLGDRDLATHVERTRRLAAGESLTTITAALAGAHGIAHRIVPMADDPAPTIVHSDEGALAFQDYFVRRQCAPKLTGLALAPHVRPSTAFAALIDDPALEGVIVCPSNPYLSIDPILALDGVRERLKARGVPIIAVSPIIAGKAVKGPAAKIMAELGVPVSSAGIADHYRGWIDGLVIDESDRAAVDEIRDMRLLVTPTLMRDDADRHALAEAVIGWVQQWHLAGANPISAPKA
ncbi:LPPG:FO 2-phospho-L-lactate transferase [Sphingomonas laterariae]|uniref:LPPG:FO 2-phospho-L-lactate transferase n=1 Tax=Edaphosphingomonas laterariae TaxID=861865 RepID=A0A239D4L3_9SPHN|nr:2-phospho-L-lactate transferase [Sphingomonas laterariae]SNS26801.1 LPPG:FO 2-phospho-L-lactate transferase [Sphingomonas laterariae]